MFEKFIDWTVEVSNCRANPSYFWLLNIPYCICWAYRLHWGCCTHSSVKKWLIWLHFGNVIHLLLSTNINGPGYTVTRFMFNNTVCWVTFTASRRLKGYQLLPQHVWLCYIKVCLDWPPSRWTMNLWVSNYTGGCRSSKVYMFSNIVRQRLWCA